MDTFEAMLTPTVKPPKNNGAFSRYFPNEPKPPVPSNNAPAKPAGAPSLETEMAKIVSTIRPDYADDIDAKVATLVSSGDVVLDTETDMYRRPHYRRYRFTTS